MRASTDELKQQFEAVSRPDPEEKKVIRSLLDSMILRHEAKRWSGLVENSGCRHLWL